MKKIGLDIIALSQSVSKTNNYAIVLAEKEGARKLPIVIGGFEAQAIAVELEHMTPNRPLTHDLFKNTLITFGINLNEVIINDLVDGIFFAKLVCEKNGEFFEIDSRTSDALALAVRFGCPVFTYDFIMESAGVLLEAENTTKAQVQVRTSEEKSIEQMNTSDLNKLLEDVLQREDYEQAAKIRDELNRRSL